MLVTDEHKALAFASMVGPIGSPRIEQMDIYRVAFLVEIERKVYIFVMLISLQFIPTRDKIQYVSFVAGNGLVPVWRQAIHCTKGYVLHQAVPEAMLTN